MTIKLYEDIISCLNKKPFLSNFTRKIFNFLDVKSLDSCRKVSTIWRDAVEKLPTKILQEIEWIDDSFSPKPLQLSNPRDLSASWELAPGNLENIQLDDDGRMALSSGREI
jgi:hypothetical protein